MKRVCALVGPTAFSAVMKRRRAGGSSHFDLFVLAASDRPVIESDPAVPPDWRLGCVIGRKAVRRAVDRNLARRIVREALRAAIDRGLKPGDYVFRARRELGPDSVKARKGPDRASFRRAMREEVDQLLVRHCRVSAPTAVAG